MKISTELLLSIVTFFHLSKSMKKGYINVAGQSMKVETFINKNSNKFTELDIFIKFLLDVGVENKGKLILGLKSELHKWALVEKEIELSYEVVPADFTHLTPFTNSQDGKLVFMDTKSGGLSRDIHPLVYLKEINNGMSEKELFDATESVTLEYRPNYPAIFDSDIPHIPTRLLNTYRPPMWKRMDAPAKKPHLLGKFFDTLFPIEEERNITFHHLHYMLKSRSQVVMCFIGAQGTGKTIFVCSIIPAMVGSQNFSKMNRAFLTKEFNGSLENAQAIVIEEIPVATNREDRITRNEILKDFSNDLITIEKKGVDPYTKKNHGSFFITGNDIRGIPLDSLAERRYMLVTMSSKRLTESLTEDEIGELVSYTDSSPEIASFCNWLLEYGKIEDKNEFYVITNDMKKKAYYSFLSRWETEVLNFIEKNKHKYIKGIPLEHILKEAQKHAKGVGKNLLKEITVQEFLSKHQMPDASFMGIVRNGGLFLSEQAKNNPVSLLPEYVNEGDFQMVDGFISTSAPHSNTDLERLKPKKITKENLL